MEENIGFSYNILIISNVRGNWIVLSELVEFFFNLVFNEIWIDIKVEFSFDL